MSDLKTYTGIGSRQISPEEKRTIHRIAKQLADLDFLCFSGNAEGSDIAFQEGSGHKCVIMLPWPKFNDHVYDVDQAFDSFVLGESEEGIESAYKFHPNKDALKKDTFLRLHARNYHQVMGWEVYPRSEFVICCAPFDSNNDESGGTGQACRIARSIHLPIINIRKKGWEKEYEQLIFNIEALGDF
jgi:hypothetical protein